MLVGCYHREGCCNFSILVKGLKNAAFEQRSLKTFKCEVGPEEMKTRVLCAFVILVRYFILSTMNTIRVCYILQLKLVLLRCC